MVSIYQISLYWILHLKDTADKEEGRKIWEEKGWEGGRCGKNMGEGGRESGMGRRESVGEGSGRAEELLMRGKGKDLYVEGGEREGVLCEKDG